MTAHNVEDIYPLSPIQEGMLFHTLADSAPDLYVHQVSFRVRGVLDVALLQLAWWHVVHQHSALRSAFVLDSGKPLQIVYRHLEVSLRQVDLRAASDQPSQVKDLADRELQRGFDLTKPPLVRFAVAQLGDGEFQLVRTSHHLAIDAWSLSLIDRDQFAAYLNLREGREPAFTASRPYRDYVAWMQRHRQDAAEYWRQALRGARTSVLRLNEATSRTDPIQYRRTTLYTMGNLGSRLAALAARYQVTLSSILQAAWGLLLSRYTGEPDTLFGLTVSGRSLPIDGIESIVGPFINTLPARLVVDPNLRLDTWLRAAFEHQKDLLAHQQSSLLEIQKLSEIPLGTPLFDNILVIESLPTEHAQLAQRLGLEMSEIEHTARDNYPLCTLIRPGAELSLSALFDTKRFSAAGILRLLGRYQTILGEMARDPEQAVGDVELDSVAERRELLQLGRGPTLDFPVDQSLHGQFEAQTRRTPHAVALSQGDEVFTYLALHERVEAIASDLAARGIAPGQLVAVVAERDSAWVATILALWRVGAAYLPLDPRHPPARHGQLIESSQPAAILASREFYGRFSSHSRPLVPIESLGSTTRPPLPPQRAGCGLDLAYVIYTSGSTGRPKGVMIPHRGMLNHLWSKVHSLRLQASDCLAQTAPSSFDISIWQCFAPLLVGARVHFVSDEILLEPSRLFALLQSTRVSVLELVPTLLHALLDILPDSHCLPDLRCLLATGEVLPPALARRWTEHFPSIPLVNAYGPTECSDDVAQHTVLLSLDPGPLPSVPIGSPLPNLTLYVHRNPRSLASRGLPGELLVGGVGVGWGYLDDPVQTALAFQPDPHALLPGSRLYRTGDRVRWLPQHCLDFLGRLDDQIKLRGHRIELGEIEAALASHPNVQRCAVMPAESPGGASLAAYVVPKQRASASDREQLTYWRVLYDHHYRLQTVEPSPASSAATIGAIHSGIWMDSFTGKPFSEAEISECVDDTTAAILALKPRRVLEIGCGSGLLLSVIAPHCQHYLGVDFSKEALTRLGRRLDAQVVSLRGVELLEADASQLELLGDRTFDVIVLNEVIQYFPSADYLVEVLRRASRLTEPGGFLFLGDVRDLRLLDVFWTSLKLFRSTPEAGGSDLQKEAHWAAARDKELLVDPRFFSLLRREIPSISGYAIRLKRGRLHNEFTKYRYNCILQIEGERTASASREPWIDWQDTGLTFEGFRERLASESGHSLKLSNIPNARLTSDLAIVELLRGPGSALTVGELRSRVAGKDVSRAPVDPWRASELAREFGWTSAFVADGNDAPGTFSMFLQRGQDDARGFTPDRPTSLPSNSRLATYTSAPSKQVDLQALVDDLRIHLRSLLPPHMLPASFTLLERFPLTDNGKLDRQALPAPVLGRSSPSAYVAPRTSLEAALAWIWSELLPATRVGVTDSFFELGGHSILAMQMASRLKALFHVDLPLRNLFDAPTVENVARELLSIEARSPDDAAARRLEATATKILEFSVLSPERRKQLFSLRRSETIP